MTSSFMRPGDNQPDERVPLFARLPRIDAPDAALIGGVTLGTLSLGSVWPALGGIFLAVALIAYALRAG